jgi:L-fuconate dehydratase
MERNVLEYVDHLHEHFLYPCSINDKGRYIVPTNPTEGYRYILVFSAFISWANIVQCDSIEMHKASIAEFEWPTGSYWVSAKGKK